VVVDLEGFRFRNDDGSETTATWMADQDESMLMGLVNTIGSPGGAGTVTPRRDENVTEDEMYIVAHIRPDNATHTGCIVSRFDSDSAGHSCHFMIRDDGALLFGYSSDGTSGGVVDLASTVAWNSGVHTAPIVAGQDFWCAVSHDPNAATRVTKFYAAPTRELLPAHQLGADVVFGSSGVIFDSPTAPWSINARVDGGFHFVGAILGVWGYAGLDESGTPLFSPDFTSPQQGWFRDMASTRLGMDDQANPWTIDGDHAILGGIMRTTAFRLRILTDQDADPATQQATLMYRRRGEPASEWRAV